MDLQQSVHNNNTSSCRPTYNTARTVAPPIPNLAITTTTNSTPATATIANNGATSAASPCSSPNANHHNQHHHHHHRNTQSLVTQKSNQVSTVLLYGIPIVSLYIEGQERLCLAQISNTLLKQFSYNEIHNRRVALGITCVQCTPVQLEILRRAGAMPVSSRRCGMITRREAERLCKSFLGDNSPPRLPEDFAFNVQHKCAWGCRGSFLPSRYNSSRAKCIKCHYCGMFFSPNKFIFHSHRIGPGDKYVQPDAANFNSWRRHMMLTGQPPQEVIYAWEDVKAMFNGGTRKRLMTTNSSSPIPRVRNPSPSSSSAGTSANSLSGEPLTTIDDEFPVSGGEPQLNNIQNVQKTTNAVNTMTAAAAVVGVTAVAVGSTVRPLNLHYQSAAAATVAGLPRESSSYAVGTDMHLIPAAALSRSFMMDYMWQHAHQAAKNTYNQHYQHQQPQQQKPKGCNSAFTLPWTKASAGTTRLDPHGHQDNSSAGENKNSSGSNANVRFSSPMSSRWTNPPGDLSQILNASAFKPVLQHQKQAVTLPSTRPRRRQLTPTLIPLPTSALASASATLPDKMQDKMFKSSFKSDDDDEHDPTQDDEDDCNNTSPMDDKRFETSEESEAMEDDIMVDIETTEDEKPIHFVANTITYTSCSGNSYGAENLEISGNNEGDDDCDNVVVVDKEHDNSSDEDVIDVVHNDNDDTVLEYSSLLPLTTTQPTRVKDIDLLDVPPPVTSPVSLLKGPNDLEKLCNSDKLNCLDYSNAENVPPPPLSVSPNCNTGSSCSRTSECFYVQAMGDNSPSYYDVNTDTTNTTPRTSSKSPESTDNQAFNFHSINFEKTRKTSRKRTSTKYQGDNEKLPWKPTQDSDTTMFSENQNNVDLKGLEESSAADTITKCKKKSVETSSKGAQFFEALTQKYELTFYNNNNSCKSNYNNNNSNSCNNNNSTNIISNNSTNNNGNEFWHMARLCMQRPINHEQNQKQQQQHQYIQQQQQQQQHGHQQLSRLPTFYYRQQQFILTPAEQQQQQQQHYSAHTIPPNRQVYLQLQQHQQNLQAVQKIQNSNNEATSHTLTTNPTTISTASSNAANVDGTDVTATCSNFRQNSHDTPAKTARANGIG